MSREYDHLLKLLLVGNTNAKTSLQRCLTATSGGEDYLSTVGVDFKIKTMELDGQFVKLQIWDTAGQERFRTIDSSYYRGTHAVIVVYDVADENSFSDAKQWLEEIVRCAGEGIEIILIGNKCDPTAEPAIEYNTAQELAEAHDIKFFEFSADNANDIENLETVVTQFVRTRISPLGGGREGQAPTNTDRSRCYLS